jgi:hypothetical protein
MIHRAHEVILFQAEQSQAIVSAIPFLQPLRHAVFFETLYPSDPGFDRGIFEIVGPEAVTALS